MIKRIAGWSRSLVSSLLVGAAVLAAPAAHAFTEGDAAIYTVADKEGKPTNIAYRFYVEKEKWIAEERAADGSWAAFKCEKNCEIKPLPPDEVARVLGKVIDGMTIACIGNGNFSVCRYILKNNPSAARHMMMVQTDKGIALVHLIWTAPI